MTTETKDITTANYGKDTYPVDYYARNIQQALRNGTYTKPVQGCSQPQGGKR